MKQSSIRLSRRPTAATGGFAAEVGRGQQISIDSCCCRVNVGPTIRRSSVGPTCLETLTFYWYFLYRARDHRRNHGWKVGRDLRWGGLPITVVFFHPFPVYPYCSTPPVSTVPFPTSLSSPPKRPFGQSAVRSPYFRAKMTTSRKSWRGPCTTGPHVLQSWRGRVPRVPYGVCTGFVSSRNAPERRSCSFFDHSNAVPVLFGI